MGITYKFKCRDSMLLHKNYYYILLFNNYCYSNTVQYGDTALDISYLYVAYILQCILYAVL